MYRRIPVNMSAPVSDRICRLTTEHKKKMYYVLKQYNTLKQAKAIKGSADLKVTVIPHLLHCEFTHHIWRHTSQLHQLFWSVKFAWASYFGQFTQQAVRKRKADRQCPTTFAACSARRCERDLLFGALGAGERAFQGLPMCLTRFHPHCLFFHFILL